jgi:hypothetical protein
MQTSIFLARLIGPILLLIGIGMLLNRNHYRAVAEDALRSPALTYVGGVLGLFGGLAVILTHNVWTLGWPLLITWLGWLAFARGALRVLFPAQAETMARSLLAKESMLTGSVVVVLALGAVLCFFGYVR